MGSQDRLLGRGGQQVMGELGLVVHGLDRPPATAPTFAVGWGRRRDGVMGRRGVTDLRAATGLRVACRLRGGWVLPEVWTWCGGRRVGWMDGQRRTTTKGECPDLAGLSGVAGGVGERGAGVEALHCLPPSFPGPWCVWQPRINSPARPTTAKRYIKR